MIPRDEPTDCALGQPVWVADGDYLDPRCQCGCRLWWIAVTGWVCTHCDDGELDHIPASEVRG